jgi:hypothetical protein
MAEYDHAKLIGQNDEGKIIGVSSSASFCPHHFARMLKGGCLAWLNEEIA